VNYKGQSCPHKPIICQEGYCSECCIYQDISNQIWDLSISLIKEYIRTLGLIWYEHSNIELENKIKGVG